MLNPRTPADRRAAEQEVLDEMGEMVQEAPLDALGQHVMTAMMDAANHRSTIGIDQRLTRAHNAVSNKYDAEDCDLLADTDVYMGITNLKVRAFRSWVADILLNAEERPWTLAPTPVPDIPEAVEDAVITAFIEEVRQFGFEGTIESRLSALKRIAQSHVQRVTTEAVGNMETLIADQLTEGGWREAFDQFIDDLGTYPAAVLKGPVVERAQKIKWQGNKAVAEGRYVFKTKRVSPYDIFPSPDSTDTQNGMYIIERSRMTNAALLDAAHMKSFREIAIRAVLESHPTGWEWSGVSTSDSEGDAEQSTDEGVVTAAAGATGTGGIYDVLIYNGKVHASLLSDAGVQVADPQRSYECEIWVCAGMVVRALLNAHPLQKRPYHATSFDKVPGSFWGRGLPDLLRDVQRVANAAARAMIRNMAFASGPIAEMDTSRMVQEDNVSEVSPYRVYRVENNSILPNSGPAIRFHDIPSNAVELMNIYERYAQQADDISGVPAYVLGNPQVAGAGRTLGGLSLLMGNAAKGIKRVISQVDKEAIEPLIETYVAFNMLTSSDPGIMADATVVARGSTGLLARELNQSKAVELLSTLAPFVQAGIVPTEGLQLVLRDVITSLGYRADEVLPSPTREAELGAFLSGAGGGGPTPAPSTTPATPQLALDGRSGAALSAIESAGSLPA